MPEIPHPFRILAPDDATTTPQPGTIDLRLEGSAFGSGRHPTTVSCLALLSGLAPLDGLRVLDLGSGSGILGIACARLGAAAVLCVDVNPDAVASARRNGATNGVDDRVAHRLGTARDLGSDGFDLVVANIGGELLLDEVGAVAPLARPGGRLVLSGLLAGHAPELADAYARLGCATLERREAEGFCTVLLERGRRGA